MACESVDIFSEKIFLKKDGDEYPSIIISAEDNKITFNSGNTIDSVETSLYRVSAGNLNINANLNFSSGYSLTGVGSIDADNITISGNLIIPTQSIAHSQLDGLENDDHVQYLKTDGSRTLAGNMNLGGFKFTNSANATADYEFLVKRQWDLDPRLGKNNTRIVSKTPGYGEYSNVQDAIDSILDASSTNTYVILVHSGTYTLSSPIIIKNHIIIQGIAKETVFFEHPMGTCFSIQEPGHIKNVTIQSCNIGLDIDSTNGLFLEEINFLDCNYPLKIRSSTFPSLVSSKDLRVMGSYTHAIDIESTAHKISIKTTSLRLYGTPITSEAIRIVGNQSFLTIRDSHIQGNGTPNVFVQYTSGTVEIIASDIENWDTVIKMPTGPITDFPIFLGSGNVFENCTKELDIINTNASGFSYSKHSFSKIFINDSCSFFIPNKDLKIITVGKTGCDFSSLKLACQTIIDQNPPLGTGYVFEVGPGTWYEHSIPTIPGFRISGKGENVTIFVTPDPTKDVFYGMPQVIIENMTIAGAYTGGTGIVNVGHPTLNRACLVRRCSFTACTFGVKTISDQNVISNTALIESYCIDTTGVNTLIYGGSQNPNPKKCYILVTNFLLRDVESDKDTNFLELFGPNTVVTLSSVQGLVRERPSGNSVAIKTYDGCNLNALSVVLEGFTTGLHVTNNGAAPNISCFNLASKAYTTDILIDNVSTTGVISGSANSSKITSHSTAVKLNVFDTNNSGYGILSIGDVAVGVPSGNGVVYYNSSKYQKDVLPKGIVGTGNTSNLLKNSSTEVLVVSGRGILRNPLDSTLREVSWGNTIINNFSPGLNFVGIDYTGNVIVSTSELQSNNTAELGRVYYSSGQVEEVEYVPFNIFEQNSRIVESLKNNVGPKFFKGGVVTETGTRNLIITQGTFYIADNKYEISGASSPTFKLMYKNGSGTWISSDTNQVPNSQYNNNGTLSNLGSFFTKHSIYAKGYSDGTTSTFYVIYGTSAYSTTGAASTAPLPEVPNYFGTTIVPIASVVVGPASINFVTIKDERSFIGTSSSSSVITTQEHSDLTGLLDDDHPQYLLVNGNRALTGTLNMNNNQIINSGNINGINISAISQRLIPSGSDPLPTASPVSISTSNFSGSQNSFSRSDHVHAHGDLAGGTLHALATISTPGFMSASEKILLSNAGSPNGLALLDGSGKIAASQIPSGNVTSLLTTTALSEGVASSFARSDHAHSIPTAVAVQLTPNIGNTVGTSSSFARADHTHNIPTAIASSFGIGATASQGTAASFARSDHVHNISLTNGSAGGSSVITTTSTSLNLMSGMQIIVNSGTYFVMFSGTFYSSNTSRSN